MAEISMSSLRDLIAMQWTTEISSLALKNLNKAKWNKPTMLPLTKDIFKKMYVTMVAQKTIAVLRENPQNKLEFKYCRCCTDINGTLQLTAHW